MVKEEVRFLAKKKRKKTVSVSKPIKKSKSKKWLFLFILGQLVGYILIFNGLEYLDKQTSADTHSRVYMTAAHLSEKEVGTKYKLLYSDKKDDIAYYIDTSYKGMKQPLQKVKIKGISSAQIIDSDFGTFTVEVSDSQEIVAGLSGERVFNSEGTKVLGFVSSMVKGGRLACIDIE